MKSVVVSVLALTVLAGSALAAIPNTMDYKLATEPLITGTIASINDHMMVVNKDQGGKVTLAVDTKTMVPTDVGPGMAMHVEFKAMPDGHLYARRITPIRGGMLAYARTGGHAPAHVASAEGNGGETQNRRRAESLPQTASAQPLVLLLGLGALASAGALAASRRLRRA
jgi:LPXTG-motif cell wall-anchored protein